MRSGCRARSLWSRSTLEQPFRAPLWPLDVGRWMMRIAVVFGATLGRSAENNWTAFSQGLPVS